MKIGVFGVGYVGLVTGVCLAAFGNEVAFYDSDREKMERLRRNEIPFFEPGLRELLVQHHERVRFSDVPADAVWGRDVVFIAVAHSSGVYAAAREIARSVDGPVLIVNKSPASLQTSDVLDRVVRDHCALPGVRVVSHPEALREGCAVADFMHAERIVLGCDDQWAENALRELYAPLDARVVVTGRFDELQVERVASRLAGVLGRLRGSKLAVLGLASKPGTSELRGSPALALVAALRSTGARVTAHDPAAGEEAMPFCCKVGAEVYGDVASTLCGVDAFVLATAWPAYRALDPVEVGRLMRRRVLFDARSALDAAAYTQAGFLYNNMRARARHYPLELQEGA